MVPRASRSWLPVLELLEMRVRADIHLLNNPFSPAVFQLADAMLDVMLLIIQEG